MDFDCKKKDREGFVPTGWTREKCGAELEIGEQTKSVLKAERGWPYSVIPALYCLKQGQLTPSCRLNGILERQG